MVTSYMKAESAQGMYGEYSLSQIEVGVARLGVEVGDAVEVAVAVGDGVLTGVGDAVETVSNPRSRGAEESLGSVVGGALPQAVKRKRSDNPIPARQILMKSRYLSIAPPVCAKRIPGDCFKPVQKL
jgi:hypothetical protein